jgi:hypothetical protein
MTPRRVASVSVLAAAAVALVACGTTSESMNRGAGKVRDGFGEAVTAPLEDLNIRRHDIPPVLLRAEANPYDLARMDHCEGIAGEVGSLDDALGPDLDEPPPPEPADPNDRRADQASQMTLNAVRDTSRGVIPFRGWVRRLTGAEQHSQAVQAAIRAGTVRRGYLKGIGMRLNCAPPAAPSWYRPTVAGQAPKPKRRIKR